MAESMSTRSKLHSILDFKWPASNVLWHSAAHNLLAMMRIGVIQGGMEVEIWRKTQPQSKNETFAEKRDAKAGAQVTRIADPLAVANAA